MAESDVNNSTGTFKEADGPAGAGAETSFGPEALLGMNPAGMTEAFRTMTERSMEQSKEAYTRMKSAADEATRSLESAMENAHEGSLSLSKKAIDALRSNADMGFAHLEAMMSAKSFADAVEMQAGYVRRQIETATDQAKDMQSLSRSIAEEMMKPGRDAFQKAADVLKRT